MVFHLFLFFFIILQSLLNTLSLLSESPIGRGRPTAVLSYQSAYVAIYRILYSLFSFVRVNRYPANMELKRTSHSKSFPIIRPF